MQDFVINQNTNEQGVADAKTPNRSPGYGGATTRGKVQAHFGFGGPVKPFTDRIIDDSDEEKPQNLASSKSILKKNHLLQSSLRLLSMGLKAKVRRTEKEMIPIMRSRICRSLDEAELNQPKTVFLSFYNAGSESKKSSRNRSSTKLSLPKIGVPTQYVRSVNRGRARYIDGDHSFNEESFIHGCVGKKPSESMQIVAGVLQQNKANKSSLEASVESFGRQVLTKYQDSLDAQLKQDKMFESKIRQAPGLFVAIKKKSDQDSRTELQGPKVTFKLAPQKKNRDAETYANPNDYRSPENQHLLKMIFQSPDNLFKKLQKMKVGSGSGKDGKDRPMEKHESNQRIMTRIFTSEAFHSALMTFKTLTSDKDIWRPQTRERGTLTRVGKNLALFGGLSNVVDPYIHFFDLRRRTWIEEDKFGEEKWGADQKCYKVDHSACFFSPYLIYFGGEVHDQHGDATSISNELVWYSIEKDQWDQSVRTKIAARELPERKNHLAFLHLSDMYVLGGHTGIYTQHLMDCYKLNLKTLVWSQVTVISIDHIYSTPS